VLVPDRRGAYLQSRSLKRTVLVARAQTALYLEACPVGLLLRVRARFMKVLLEEHDSILRSYRAQKYGDGDGIAAKPGRERERRL